MSIIIVYIIWMAVEEFVFPLSGGLQKVSLLGTWLFWLCGMKHLSCQVTTSPNISLMSPW